MGTNTWLTTQLALGLFRDLYRKYEKTDKTIKETTEENHESIQTDRLPLSTGLALRDFVANDRGKDGDRRSEWEGYRLKDSVSSNDSKRKEATVTNRPIASDFNMSLAIGTNLSR